MNKLLYNSSVVLIKEICCFCFVCFLVNKIHIPDFLEWVSGYVLAQSQLLLSE